MTEDTFITIGVICVVVALGLGAVLAIWRQWIALWVLVGFLVVIGLGFFAYGATRPGYDGLLELMIAAFWIAPFGVGLLVGGALAAIVRRMRKGPP